MKRASRNTSRARRRPEVKSAPPQKGRKSHLRRFGALVIVVACAVTYANTLNNPFLFDDHRAIQENSTIRQLSSLAVLTPPERTSVAGRPLANVSFALNYAVGGLDVQGYHIVNIAIHALVALLVFHVLRRAFARHAGQGIAAPDTLAFTCALVWSVHTLNSEVVNYLAERTESLMALFYLLALSCAIAALDSRRVLLWELCAVVAAICAVNSKEPAVTLPAAIALWDRMFAFPTLRAAWTARRRLYLSITAVCLVFGFMVRLVHVPGTDMSSWDYLINRAADLNVSPWIYLLNQAPIIVQYLWLSIWPAHLVLDYGFAQPVGVSEVWPALLFVSGLLSLSLSLSRWKTVRVMSRGPGWRAGLRVKVPPSLQRRGAAAEAHSPWAFARRLCRTGCCRCPMTCGAPWCATSDSHRARARLFAMCSTTST